MQMKEQMRILTLSFIVTLLIASIPVSSQLQDDSSKTKHILFDNAVSIAQMIFVDDDFTPATPGWQITCFNTIEDGLRAVREHGILYVYNGFYPEGSIIVDKTITLIGENSHRTVIDGSTGLHDNTIEITADHVRIKGFTIRNNRTSASAITILSHHTTLAHNIIDGFASGVLLQGYLGDTRFTTITNNQFLSSGIIINGEELPLWNTHTITHNTIQGSPIYYYKDGLSQTIHVPSNAGQIILANYSNIKITHLTVPEIPRAIQIAYSQDIIIQQNLFQGGNVNWPSSISTAVYTYESQYIHLYENTISGYSFGVFYQRTTQSIIRNNIFSDNIVGFYSYDCNDDIIEYNTFIHNPDIGILLSYSTYMRVLYNAVTQSNQGISLLFDSNDHTITDNLVTQNQYGIHLGSRCLRNTIENNTITTNEWGIYLFVDSSENTLSKNIITSNTYGVTFDGAGFNYVFENTIQNNILSGFRLQIHDEYWEQFWSNGNQIYHNNFIDNPQQAFDECYNTWDNDLPSGGNYWSDYDGVDINPPFGIGDAPYNITGQIPPNQDRYPFMKPNGWTL